MERALEAKNWIVHPQAGVSYFRVNFGIVHPDKPGVYLAGVEADGAQFHRSPTARDRDKLRQAALENLGWRIIRIWSTEWWLDSSAALEKVHQRLLGLLEHDRACRTQESVLESGAPIEGSPKADGLDPTDAVSPLDDHDHIRVKGIRAVESAVSEPNSLERELV